jgi:hypothetical protein
MWKANGKATTLQISWAVSLQKTLSLEEAMDLSRDRNELLLAFIAGRDIPLAQSTVRSQCAATF